MSTKEEITQDLREEIEKNLGVILSLVQEGDSSKIRRGLQHFTFLKFQDAQRSVFDMIMSHAINAEKICPGAGILFLKLFCRIPIEEKKKIKKRSDVKELIESLTVDPAVKNLILSSLELFTLNSKILIRKSTSNKPFVEVTEGYLFEVKSLLRTGNCDIKNARVCCIDGYIESVSEIHRLLTELSEKKESCVLLCRGVSNDVLHTLKVNYDRKTVTVYPYVIPFDIENVNTIVDIATVSGTDVTSSLKGDLISSVDLSRTGQTDRVFLSESSIRIINQQTKSRVDSHLSNLLKTIQEKPEVEEILSKRIKSLNSSCIEIGIPDDVRFYSTSQQLDYAIRVVSSVVNNTYDPVEAAKMVYLSFDKLLTDTSVHLL